MKLKSFLLAGFIFATNIFASEVNVYTHRHYDADKMLFNEFTQQTGITVNVVKAKADELIKRLEIEGDKSPADVLITVDAGRLYLAKEKNLLQSISSKTLETNIPSHLRDEDNQWFAITKRARVIVYKKDKINPKDLSSFEDLANPKFKGKILVRSSNNIYNQSLLASIIAHHGSEYAQKWAEGIVANLARDPKGNDRDQVKAVAAGIGDIAIVNTYYLGMMATDDKNQAMRDAASQVGVFFPKSEKGNRGSHINVSGAGVAKYSKNRDNAIKFIEFLSSKRAQSVLAESNFEYPVLKDVKSSDLVQSWGDFNEDNLNLNELGRLNKESIMVFDKANWR